MGGWMGASGGQGQVLAVPLHTGGIKVCYWMRPCRSVCNQRGQEPRADLGASVRGWAEDAASEGDTIPGKGCLWLSLRAPTGSRAVKRPRETRAGKWPGELCREVWEGVGLHECVSDR